jgi:hypothetical protein
VNNDEDVDVPESQLWDLIEKWRAKAVERDRGKYLNADPVIAFGQAMTEAAEDLADLILEVDEANHAVGVTGEATK